MKTLFSDFKNLCCQQQTLWKTGLLFSLLGIVFGTGVLILAFTVGEPATTYINSNFLMTAMLLIIFCFLNLPQIFSNRFQLALGFGVSRRRQICASLLFHLVIILAVGAVLYLAAGYDTLLHQLFFSEYPTKVELAPWVLPFHSQLLVLLCVYSLTLFVSALNLKIGQKAQMIFWFSWCGGFLLFPRIGEAIEQGTNSLAGMLGRGLVKMFGEGAVSGSVLLTVVSVILLLVSVLMIRKAEVRI